MTTGAATRTATPWTRIGSLAVRAVRLELLLYASIGRALARRPAVPVGAKGFRYDSTVLLLLGVLAVVSAVEVVALDLILRRWPPVRIPFLVLGIWGTVFGLGLFCAHVMRPHTVGPDGIRIRDGFDLDLGIDWAVIHSLRPKRRTYDTKPPRVLDCDGSDILVVPVSSETNVEVTFEQPTTVRLPGHPPKGGDRVVSGARLWVDDPKGFLAGVKEHFF
jgi:hypothetical protein